MLRKFGLAFLLTFFCITTSFGKGDILNPNHPDQYVVVKGDTLWDISGRFLRAPWLWPEVWQVNPQIKNPHLIYPGDLISLIYVNGQPRLVLSRGSDVRLSPSVRITPNAAAISTIPIEIIYPFLKQSGVMSQQEYDSAAYVLATPEEQVATGAGDRVYIRGIPDQTKDAYKLVRKGGEFKNPEDGIGVGNGKAGESLGFEADYLADAQVTDFGEVSTAIITRSTKETSAGDRALPAPEDQPYFNFFPRAPKQDITGAIVGIVDDNLEIGRYSVVAINLGAHDQMEVGFVMDLHHKGKLIQDKFIKSSFNMGAASQKQKDKTPTPSKMVRLPDERIGELLIFRVFDRISYGLVLTASETLKQYDLVKTPK